MEQVMREAMAEPYDLLLGRATYEMFAGDFAGADKNPVAEKLNAATKFVVTSSSKELAWQNSRRIGGDIAMEISQFKTQDGPLLQVHGSWQLVQLLLSHRLVDEFRLWTFPVVVGSGKRLFADGAVPTTLELTKHEPLSCGAAMTFYRRVEPIKASPGAIRSHRELNSLLL